MYTTYEQALKQQEITEEICVYPSRQCLLSPDGIKPIDSMGGGGGKNPHTKSFLKMHQISIIALGMFINFFVLMPIKHLNAKFGFCLLDIVIAMMKSFGQRARERFFHIHHCALIHSPQLARQILISSALSQP